MTKPRLQAHPVLVFFIEDVDYYDTEGHMAQIIAEAQQLRDEVPGLEIVAIAVGLPVHNAHCLEIVHPARFPVAGFGY